MEKSITKTKNISWRKFYTTTLRNYVYRELKFWKSLADFYAVANFEFDNEFADMETEANETVAIYATALQDLYNGVMWETVAKTLGVKYMLEINDFTIDTAA